MKCDNVYIKIFPKQKCFKETNGETSEVPLRLGRLTTDLYRNRTVINTIYGDKPFVPRIEIYVEFFTDIKGYMTINIINDETKTTAKQIVIRTQPNNMTIKALKNLYDEIMVVLDKYENEAVVKLIELIQSKSLDVEEYC